MITRPADSAELPVRDQLDLCRGELVRIRRCLDAAEQANHRLADAHAELDERYGMLTKLFVAADAMHDATTEIAVLRAISEVMINLAGTEEFGIYEVGPNETLTLLYEFGLEARRTQHLLPSGEVGLALLSGQAWTAPAPHPAEPGEEPVACIPLRLGETVSALIIAWSFLPQKRAFDGFDVELYALLTNRAAAALRAARLVEAAG